MPNQIGEIMSANNLNILIDQWLNKGIIMLGQLIIALLIFFIGKWLVKKVVRLVDTMMQHSKLDKTVANFMGNILYGLLMAVVVMAALSRLGVNTNSVVAILGGATVAVGLALKDQLSNFAAGVIIVLFRPFNKGDMIEIKDNKGRVNDITLVNTRLTTLDNHEIVIPNSQITTTAVTNFSAMPTRRVQVVLGIGYGDDIKTAKDILLSLAQGHDLALKDPAPTVLVTDLGDSSVELTLTVWSANSDWWNLKCDLLEQAKYAMDNASIEIPFPQSSISVVGLDKLLAGQKSDTGL